MPMRINITQYLSHCTICIESKLDVMLQKFISDEVCQIDLSCNYSFKLLKYYINSSIEIQMFLFNQG